MMKIYDGRNTTRVVVQLESLRRIILSVPYLGNFVVPCMIEVGKNGAHNEIITFNYYG